MLSTLDSLAEACAKSNHPSHAIKYYNEILERFHRNPMTVPTKGSTSNRRKRAEAVLLYKMSRVHKQQDDRESELGKLRLALRAIRSLNSAGEGEAGSAKNSEDRQQAEALERRIQNDIRSAREATEKIELQWV